MPGVRVGVEAAISLEWVSAPALDERALGGSQKTWPSPPATTGHLGVSLARRLWHFPGLRSVCLLLSVGRGKQHANLSGAVNKLLETGSVLKHCRG